MSYGKFIVIDGSDGAGKKTQSDLLINRLKDLGKEVAYYDFPQYSSTFFGAMVGRYLNGEFGKADEVNPYLCSLLYAGDRFQAKANMIKDLEAGKIVVSNRYTQSNMAFQAAKIKDGKEKKKFLEWLNELEFGVYQIPKADAVVYLYMPYAVSQKLVSNKSARDYTKMKLDIHEKDTDLLKRVEKEYLQLAKDNSEWIKVDCWENEQIMTPNQISDIVFKALEKSKII